VNWVGDFCQNYIEPVDSVLDLGCGIMQATMDTCPSYPKTKLKCGDLVGVDIYQPYLKFLRERNIQVFKADLRCRLPFSDKTFDVVLLLDVLEHLSLKDAAKLVEEAERVARKYIVVLTPKKFFPNEEQAVSNPFPYSGLGYNLFQIHKCLISKSWLEENGFQLSRNLPSKYATVHQCFAVKKVSLRILHVWCQAGVAALMAKYQRRLGHTAHVVKGQVSSIDRFYGNKQLPELPNPHLDRTMQRKVYASLPSVLQSSIKKFVRFTNRSLGFYINVRHLAKDYDILHIHSAYKTLFFLPFKPKILEFHGDDVRRHPSFRSKLKLLQVRFFVWIAKFFMCFYVSTPDLINEVPNSFWIPNPVDLDHFHKRGGSEANTALYLHNWYETGDHAKRIAEEKNLKLTVLDRAYPKEEWIDHAKFPDYLAKFEYFIGRKEIPSLSKSALEALALGLKVVQGWNNKTAKALNVIHHPMLCAKRTVKIYRNLLSCKEMKK